MELQVAHPLNHRGHRSVKVCLLYYRGLDFAACAIGLKTLDDRDKVAQGSRLWRI